MENFITKKHLTRDICKSNFERLCKEYKNTAPRKDIVLKSKNLSVTHTFSDSKLFHIFPVKKMDISGLYAQCWQEAAEPIYRNDGAAYQVGLYEYVFGYHGIHDPYYACNRKTAKISFPIGVFIDRNYEKAMCDEVHLVNSTYRDLSSTEISEPYSKWFISTEQARDMVAYDIHAKHNGDFWKYWGNPNLEYFKSETHWTQLLEFHFHRYVPVSAFAAILWPKRRIFDLNQKKYIFWPFENVVFDRIKENYPEVKFYFYQVPATGKRNATDDAFRQASFEIANKILAKSE